MGTERRQVNIYNIKGAPINRSQKTLSNGQKIRTGNIQKENHE